MNEFSIFECILDLDTKNMYMITGTDTSLPHVYEATNLETHEEVNIVMAGKINRFVTIDSGITEILYKREFEPKEGVLK